MQALIPPYLDASMDQFRANQAKLNKAFEDSIESNPLARLAQQNMAMLRAAASAFIPGSEGAANAEPATEAPAGAPRDELEALRNQMAEMQKKLDLLVK